MDSEYSRRRFLKSAITIAGSVPFIHRTAFSFPEMKQQPRFFLQVLIRGGLNCGYFFDARPLAFTRYNKIQNFLGVEPTKWTGVNGVSTFSSHLVDPLKKFRDQFSIVNGAIMAVGNDSHDGNQTFCFTNNTDLGDSFHLSLGRLAGGLIRTVELGDREDDSPRIVNHSSHLALSTSDPFSILNKFAASKAFSGDRKDLVSQVDNAKRLAGGRSFFSIGSQAYSLGLASAPESSRMLKRFAQMSTKVPSVSDTENLIGVAMGAWKAGLASTAIMHAIPNVDFHDPESAKNEGPSRYAGVVSYIEQIFETLNTFDADLGCKWIDVTTVLVTSEFNRTMRQIGLPVEKSGTDHNQLSNFILLGGAGIRGGQVIGSTDLQDLTDGGDFARVSKAHRILEGGSDIPDSQLVKAIGRPFDFAKSESDLNAFPDEYHAEHYLNYASVVNTVLRNFDSPKDFYWNLGRTTTKAPIIQKLLR